VKKSSARLPSEGK